MPITGTINVNEGPTSEYRSPKTISFKVSLVEKAVKAQIMAFQEVVTIPVPSNRKCHVDETQHTARKNAASVCIYQGNSRDCSALRYKSNGKRSIEKATQMKFTASRYHLVCVQRRHSGPDSQKTRYSCPSGATAGWHRKPLVSSKDVN